MSYFKLVHGTTTPTRYTKIIMNPGAGTKYNRQYQETDYVSRYTKLAAPPASYVPPDPPEPEYNEPLVKTKAMWHIDNVYEVGQEVTAIAATWREGNPETQTYRSRWQTRLTSSDNWTNSSWINDPTNQQVNLTFTLTEPGELRFQSQVRDTSWDPVMQVNSFASIQNVGPSDEPLSVVLRTSTSGSALVGSTLTGTLAEYKGGKAPVLEEYQWQKSASGTGNWAGLTNWTSAATQSPATLQYTTGNGEVGMYVRFGAKATDADGTISYGSGNAIGPIESPTTIGAPTITINDVEVVYGEPVHVPVNTPVHAEATITGDASPSYKWEARGDYPMMVGQQAATTTLTFPEEGAPTVTLTITDSTATDSPISYAMSFYVASQLEWEILHPEDNLN